MMSVRSRSRTSVMMALVSDLLLTLIILEVMTTVVCYFQSRETSLKLFLIIGIISATRSALAVGARLSVSAAQQLQHRRVPWGHDRACGQRHVIVALGVTLRLIGSCADERLST